MEADFIMTDTRKPREFWAVPPELVNEMELSPSTDECVDTRQLHVIEYSAYIAEANAHIQTAGMLQTVIEALRKERDSVIERRDFLQAELNKIVNAILALAKERDAYRAVLEKINNHWVDYELGEKTSEGQIAHEVLAKYPKESHDKT